MYSSVFRVMNSLSIDSLLQNKEPSVDHDLEKQEKTWNVKLTSFKRVLQAINIWILSVVCGLVWFPYGWGCVGWGLSGQMFTVVNMALLGVITLGFQFGMLRPWGTSLRLQCFLFLALISGHCTEVPQTLPHWIFMFCGLGYIMIKI